MSDLHGRIEAATITTADLATAERFWTERLGHQVRDRGGVAEALATSWGTPAQSGRPYVLLGPASGADVWIRLVEGERPEGCAPRRSLGWAALEITVQDADQLCAQLRAAGTNILGEPQLLEFSDKFYPMQAEGPAGEVLYLNEVRGNLPDMDLPLAQSFVDHLFIVILAAPDLDAALAFYRDRLGFEPGASFEIAYKMINSAFDLDPDTRHRLATTSVGRRVNVEVDQYPQGTPPRESVSGQLPPAAAMVTFAVRDLDAVGGPWRGPIVTRPELPYGGRRSAVCEGAAGELVEVVEVG